MIIKINQQIEYLLFLKLYISRCLYNNAQCNLYISDTNQLMYYLITHLFIHSFSIFTFFVFFFYVNHCLIIQILGHTPVVTRP